MVATYEVARARSASNQASDLARGGATPPSSVKGPSAEDLFMPDLSLNSLERSATPGANS